jgi:hypothetical protein
MATMVSRPRATSVTVRSISGTRSMRVLISTIAERIRSCRMSSRIRPVEGSGMRWVRVLLLELHSGLRQGFGHP